MFFFFLCNLELFYNSLIAMRFRRFGKHEQRRLVVSYCVGGVESCGFGFLVQRGTECAGSLRSALGMGRHAHSCAERFSSDDIAGRQLHPPRVDRQLDRRGKGAAERGEVRARLWRAPLLWLSLDARLGRRRRCAVGRGRPAAGGPKRARDVSHPSDLTRRILSHTVL